METIWSENIISWWWICCSYQIINHCWIWWFRRRDWCAPEPQHMRRGSGTAHRCAKHQCKHKWDTQEIHMATSKLFNLKGPTSLISASILELYAQLLIHIFLLRHEVCSSQSSPSQSSTITDNNLATKQSDWGLLSTLMVNLQSSMMIIHLNAANALQQHTYT